MVALGATSYAQFTMDGEFRPRFEYRHGYKSVADSAQDAAAFIEQRLRLNLGYATEGYNFKVTLQDILVWGSQPQLVNTYNKINGNGSYLSLHEAWGEVLFSENWRLKLGRQEIVLDDSRIFGNVGWAQQGRSHDAAIVKYKRNTFEADLGLAYNQDRAGLVGTDAFRGGYKAFQYLWLHRKFGDNVKASILALNNGKEQMAIDRAAANAGSADSVIYKDKYSQTFGTRVTYGNKKLKVGAAFYAQMGLDADRNNIPMDQSGTFDRKISAMNLRVEAAYKITNKFTGTLGFEHMSGNSQTDTSAAYLRTNHAFTPFYGTNHKFNGLMDYFYVGNHVGNVGLNDIFIKLKYKAPKFWVGANVHLFSAAADVWDGYKFNKALADAVANGTPAEVTEITGKQFTGYKMNRSFGTEVDLLFGFKLAKGVDLKGGYSTMLASETLAYVKGTVDYKGQGRTDQNNSWGWVMVTIKPKFISPKKK